DSLSSHLSTLFCRDVYLGSENPQDSYRAHGGTSFGRQQAKRSQAMKKLLAILTILGMSTVPVLAQTAESNWYSKLQAMDSSQLVLLAMVGVVLLIIVLLLILMVYLMSFLSAVLRKENQRLAAERSWWESFKKRYITGQVDEVGGEEEKAKLMSNHSYDGITELDNFMPPWLQWVFVSTIVIAVIYFVHYSVLGNGATGIEEYEEELR